MGPCSSEQGLFFVDFDALKEKKVLKVVKEDYNGYFCPLICKKTIIIIHY